MIWFKSVLVGMAAALVTVVAVVLAMIAWFAWFVDIDEGSGSIVHVFIIGPVELLLGMVGFALGFRWSVRRQRRRRVAPTV